MTPDHGSIHWGWRSPGTVAEIILDRPAKLNALTPTMLAQLEQACREINTTSAQLAVVRAEGDRAFSVGADITQFASLDGIAMWRSWVADGHRTFAALAHLRCPTMAVIDGPAFGGGFELALACDLRLASTAAIFALPEVGLGTVPGWAGTGRLPALVGGPRAKELIFTRRRLDAQTALSWGVVNAVAEPGQLQPTVQSWVDDILGSAPIAVALSKQLIDASLAGAPIATVEAMASGLAAGTADLAEGIAAFQERRTPQFGGR
ncbi:MAG: enoyl-CoA hydratase/isomerase family protein [Beutenbergiaceae bacterium]